jgi:hypothetical protein
LGTCIVDRRGKERRRQEEKRERIKLLAGRRGRVGNISVITIQAEYMYARVKMPKTVRART